LAFQYHYQPPVAGTEIESTTYGRQTADNLVGGYYCWNRRYDPTIGRWTTPDPAVRPWWNLSEVVAQSPTQASDPTGLCPRTKDGKRCSPEGSTETSIVTCPCTHGIGISDVQWDGKHRLIDGEMTCTVKCTCEGS